MRVSSVRPETFLEQLDLAAQKRWRHAEILRRTREAAAFDDAAEGLHDGKLVHLGMRSLRLICDPKWNATPPE